MGLIIISGVQGSIRAVNAVDGINQIADWLDELNIASDQVNYIIRDLGDKTYLFITKKVDLDHNTYKVSYAKDISSIYNNRENLLNLLLRLNLLVSGIWSS